MADDKPPMPPSRALVLNVMLSFLVSAAVFVVVSWLVIVPQMARQQVQIQELQGAVAELREQLDEGEDEAPPAPAAVPGAAAPPAAATAPAPAAAPGAPSAPAKK